MQQVLEVDADGKVEADDLSGGMDASIGPTGERDLDVAPSDPGEGGAEIADDRSDPGLSAAPWKAEPR